MNKWFSSFYCLYVWSASVASWHWFSCFPFQWSNFPLDIVKNSLNLSSVCLSMYLRSNFMPSNLRLAFCFHLALYDSQKRDLCSRPYSVTVINRIPNSLMSYDTLYRSSFPLKEHLLSVKQTLSTCMRSQARSNNKVHWCEGKTWDVAWRGDPAWKNDTD